MQEASGQDAVQGWGKDFFDGSIPVALATVLSPVPCDTRQLSAWFFGRLCRSKRLKLANEFKPTSELGFRSWTVAECDR